MTYFMMKSWDVDITEPFNLEGMVIGLSLVKNEDSYPFADLTIQAENGKRDDVEIPITPIRADSDINFLSLNHKMIIGKKISYKREVVNDWGDSITVAYRLEVMEEDGPLYAQVVKLHRQRNN